MEIDKDADEGLSANQIYCKHGTMFSECARCELERERDLLRRQVEEKNQRIEWLEKRDLKATIELCYDDGQDPFERERLKVVDVGVADNIYVVHSEVADLLRRQVEVLADAMCRTSVAGIRCVDAIKQWSLRQAKNGGG